MNTLKKFFTENLNTMGIIESSDPDNLTVQGIREIAYRSACFINENKLYSGSIYYDALLSAICSDLNYDFNVVNTHGKLIKRIGKLIKQYYGVEITKYPHLVGSLGDIIRDHTISNNVFWDITNQFNWESGDFGDSGSCYWTCRTKARDILEKTGAFALRTYCSNMHKNSNGRSRVWLYPLPQYNGYGLFNAYGGSLGEHATILDQILTSHNIEHYIKENVQFTVNGTGSGLIWINGEKCRLLSENEQEVYSINAVNSLVNSCVECVECGDDIELDSDAYLIYDGDYYCNNCFGTCSHCNERLPLNHFEYANDYLYICNYCIDEYFTCDKCGDFTENCDSHEIQDTGEIVCNYCFERHYFECVECGHYFKDTILYEYNHYCESCFQDNFTSCDICGEIVELSDSENGTCYNCMKELENENA